MLLKGTEERSCSVLTPSRVPVGSVFMSFVSGGAIAEPQVNSDFFGLLPRTAKAAITTAERVIFTVCYRVSEVRLSSVSSSVS